MIKNKYQLLLLRSYVLNLRIAVVVELVVTGVGYVSTKPCTNGEHDLYSSVNPYLKHRMEASTVELVCSDKWFQR